MERSSNPGAQELAPRRRQRHRIEFLETIGHRYIREIASPDYRNADGFDCSSSFLSRNRLAIKTPRTKMAEGSGTLRNARKYAKERDKFYQSKYNVESPARDVLVCRVEIYGTVKMVGPWVLVFMIIIFL